MCVSDAVYAVQVVQDNRVVGQGNQVEIDVGSGLGAREFIIRGATILGAHHLECDGGRVVVPPGPCASSVLIHSRGLPLNN